MFIFSYDKINSVGIFGQIFVKNLFNIKMYFLRIKWQHLYKNFKKKMSHTYYFKTLLYY